MSNEEYFAKYDKLVNKNLEILHAPGVSVAVVDGNSTYSKGYGFARLPNEKVTTSTLFNAASMSKAFVSSAISLLVDDEDRPDVQWSTPVSRLMGDDFVLSDSRYTEAVTVEDILSHRSGLPDHDDACMGIYAKNPDTPKSVTRKLRYLPLSQPLRTTYQYSNVMYVVAVHLVEFLTESWFGDFVRQKLWEPLGMKNTYFGLDDVKKRGPIAQLAKGYRWDEESSTYADVPWPVQPEGAGAGEVQSTATDYAAFLRCMIEKTGPLSEDGHEELVKPRTITDDKVKPFHSHSLYALGWEVYTYHGETIIGHDGSTSGYQSKMLYIPQRKWGVVVFGNGGGAYRVAELLCSAMVDDLLNVPLEQKFDWEKHWSEEDKELECKSIEELYPELPDTPIPTTLPLSSYAGSYTDDGYGTLVVEYKDGKLHVDCTDRTWRFKLSLEHVSGEFFVAALLDIDIFIKANLRAQFRLDAKGTVSEFGVDFSEDLEGLIWFQRAMTSEELLNSMMAKV